MMRRFLGLFVLIIFASCETDRLDVDVSMIEVKPMKFERFDNDFFALDTASLASGLEQLLDGLAGRGEGVGQLVDEFAAGLGGNAVIGVDLDYEVLGKAGSMLMVSATGTAVVV